MARISVSPVEGFRLVAHPEEVELGPDGVAENRRFFLVGPDGQRLRSTRGHRASDGAILYGVYGQVVQPGRVRVGDAVEPLA